MLASLARRVSNLLVAGSALAALATLLAWGARLWWPLELLVHFRPQYLLALAVGVLLAAALRQRRTAALFAVAALVNLWLVAPLYFGGSRSTSAAAQPVAVDPDSTPTADDEANGNISPPLEPVRLLLANLLHRNRDHEPLARLIADVAPDVILLLEVNHTWARAIEPLETRYPYSIVLPREDSFGIALFSRLPADELKIREIGPAEVPSIYARLRDAAGRPFNLIGTHPLPPIGAKYSALRNQQLAEVGQFAAEFQGPVILMGDLNATSWSPYFADLLATSGLRDSRRGFGISATWPSGLARLGIPIDHVLVSPDIRVHQRRVAAPIGSDHRPVIVDVDLAAAQAPPAARLTPP